MQSYRYDANYASINNTSELIPFLDNCLEKTAWLIITYHSIEFYEGYGFYEMEDFKSDMFAIKSRDFWNVSMNQAVLYIKEKEKSELSVQYWKNKYGDVENVLIYLNDNLPDDYYDQPLTISFDLPSNWINRGLGLFKNENQVDSVSFNSLKAKISIIPAEGHYELALID
ncbi:MAG TPA: hypothetical protein VMT35_18780 [Ignavibacteriaceae bacterium]|nr:hypothetical protein [Ignavibacteriaceae bacterium]